MFANMPPVLLRAKCVVVGKERANACMHVCLVCGVPGVRITMCFHCRRRGGRQERARAKLRQRWLPVSEELLDGEGAGSHVTRPFG